MKRDRCNVYAVTKDFLKKYNKLGWACIKQEKR
jgi:hypothetical protein